MTGFVVEIRQFLVGRVENLKKIKLHIVKNQWDEKRKKEKEELKKK